MTRPSPTFWSRRELLSFTMKLAAAGIATSLTPELIHAQQGTDLKGVTIDYWNAVGTQNAAVRKISEAVVAAFEQRTGAKVNVTWDSYDSLSSGKHAKSFESGTRPTVLDANSRWTGALRPWLKPLNELMESAWDADAHTGIQWTLPAIEKQNQGFSDAKTIYDLPFGVMPQGALVTRFDHWVKAGIEVPKNWPLKDTLHLLSILIGLRDNGQFREPIEAYGNVPVALARQIAGWARSIDADASTLLTADWTASTGDHPAWQQAVQFYVDVGGKFKLSSRGWPETTERDALDKFVKQEKSFFYADLLQQHVLLQRMPERMSNNSIVWGLPVPLKGGKAGGLGFTDFMTLSIVKQEGPDAELKERAAWEFVKEWFLKENQVAYGNSAILCSRKDFWPVQFDPRDRFMQIAMQLIVNSGVWPNHPRAGEIYHGLFTKHVLRARAGEPVPTVLADYAKDVNTLLQA